MKALKLDFFDQIDANETILFEARPNPFLYGLEASRAPIVAMFGLSAFVVAVLMITKGGPFLFLLKVVLLLDFIFFSVFFLAVVLIACRLSFVLTNQKVVIRGVSAQFGVRLDEIKSVSVRSYGVEYGSVYLERYRDTLEAVYCKSLNLNSQSGSIWLSMPRSRPQLMGFLGFKDFNKFASGIIDLRNASHLTHF
ncbi:MAG TPA: hypothetical protein VK734_13485 [Bradyrhizobium sp.]|jgi:hypothetical protein|nr:hypothetical protein [Bradyrhizobium sp.]